MTNHNAEKAKLLEILKSELDLAVIAIKRNPTGIRMIGSDLAQHITTMQGTRESTPELQAVAARKFTNSSTQKALRESALPVSSGQASLNEGFDDSRGPIRREVVINNGLTSVFIFNAPDNSGQFLLGITTHQPPKAFICSTNAS